MQCPHPRGERVEQRRPGLGDEGDLVVVQEGWGASTAATGEQGAAIDSAIVGVVDRVDLLEAEA